MVTLRARTMALNESLAEPVADNFRARRRGERYNFLEGLRSADIAKDCAVADHFHALLALAINDYGVSRKSLAALLGVSEGAVSRWLSEKATPPAYARPQIIGMLAGLLAATLKAEDAGQRLPEDLESLRRLVLSANG